MDSPLKREPIMDAEIFVPFVFFTFLTLVIVGPILAKEQTKRSAHNLISQALARGQDLDPALVSQLSQGMFEENRARRSLGSGVIMLALAGGFIGAGAVIARMDGASEGLHAMMIPAIILGSVGAAYLILAIFDYASKKREA